MHAVTVFLAASDIQPYLFGLKNGERGQGCSCVAVHGKVGGNHPELAVESKHQVQLHIFSLGGCWMLSWNAIPERAFVAMHEWISPHWDIRCAGHLQDPTDKLEIRRTGYHRVSNLSLAYATIFRIYLAANMTMPFVA